MPHAEAQRAQRNFGQQFKQSEQSHAVGMPHAEAQRTQRLGSRGWGVMGVEELGPRYV